MKLRKKYILLIICIALISIICIVKSTYSKYVITDSKVAFHIDKLMEDKVKPTIDGNDKSYTDEEYYTNQDQKIDYDDNIKVADARYWYNEDEKEFPGDGKKFDSGTIFTEEGWYKIVITDIFDNTNTVIFLLDKTNPTIYADAVNTTDDKAKRSTSSQIDSTEFKQWFISDVKIAEYDKYGIKYTCEKINPNTQSFNSVASEKNDIGKGRIDNIWTFTDKSYYLITATDLCTNKSTLVIGIDKVKPTITTLSNDYTKSNKNININYTDDFSGIKEVKYSYNANSERFTSYSDINNNTTLTNDGYYHFKLEDVAGNTNEYTVVIDKTPPVISVKPDGESKTDYPNTTNDVIKSSKNITLSTSDNFEIDYNEYWYNPNSNSFNGEGTRFDNGKKLEDDGYYKITAHDTFGNTTTIIILIDKTPPEVTVKYYKKNQISLLNTNDNLLYGKETLKIGGIING